MKNPPVIACNCSACHAINIQWELRIKSLTVDRLSRALLVTNELHKLDYVPVLVRNDI